MELNQEDLSVLTAYWQRETTYANEKVDQACRSMQDHAYALGLARGRAEAAAAAVERVRATEIVAEETAQGMREAIAKRVADVGKPTAWADGLCAA